MKFFINILVLFFSTASFSQEIYWQQQVNYNIDVKVNDKDNTLDAFERIVYINHSPDTLNFIWFHLWPNAYKNDETAYARQLKILSHSQKRKKGSYGFIDSLNFRIDDQSVIIDSSGNIDVIKIFLPRPLNPEGQIIITTPFHVKIPSYVSRLGYSHTEYMISQWYPKPAVYDRKGWHQMPYLDEGEFYSEFGDFKVNITLPSNYVVGATGVLQNENEKNIYKSIGKKNKKLLNQISPENSNPVFGFYNSPILNQTKTLSYIAKNVHDFAWFADKSFIINYDTLKLNADTVIDIFTFYHSYSKKGWYNSVDYLKDATNHYSTWVGSYQYPVINAVEGPSNINAGGMEYPMISLINNNGENEKQLDGIIAHEAGHNWFYAILGTNERAHAWMDEGINSYYEFRYEAEKYKTNIMLLSKINPDDFKNYSTDQFLAAVFSAMNEIPMKEPIETSSEIFTSRDDYSFAEYIKPAIWMYELQLSMGSEKFFAAMKGYFNDWKFKHPYPEDMKISMENHSNMGLDNLFRLLIKKGNIN